MGTANKNIFGEAIPYSRADIMASYDFSSLCRCDLEKNVTKAKIWKMPAAEKFIEKDCKGNVALAFWKKSMRDAVSSKPDRWFAGREDTEPYETYAKEVAYLRDAVMASDTIGMLRIGALSVSAYDTILGRYFDSRYSGRVLSRNHLGRVIFSDSFDIMRVSNWTTEMAEKRAKAKGYGKSKEDKAKDKAQNNVIIAEYSNVTWSAKKGRGFLNVFPEGSAYRYQFPEAITPSIESFINYRFFVVDVSDARSPKFYFMDTREEAENIKADLVNAAVEARVSGTDIEKKKRFSYSLDKIEQTGGLFNDKNNYPVTPEEIQESFMFRGGEFGNWMSEKDIQASLDASFTAFHNLAYVLGINTASISFDGKMGIAYGSRGHGKAAAHYEHGATDVINLTKMSGAGCLAHEWGHALDRHIADALGMTAGTLASTKTFGLPKELTNVYRLFESGTRYYRDSSKYGNTYQKAGGYWDSKEELFARAFDCYILDKLNAAGIKDTYLTAYAEQYKSKDANGNDVYAYPIKEERKDFEKAFDALIEWAKKNKVIERI